MTSNVGADMIKRQSSLGFSLKHDEDVEERLAYEEMRKKLMDSLRRVFRPEFINRLDSVITFRALSKDDIKKIVELELEKVAQRLKEYSISLTATPAALDKLAEMGYDPEMGARPLKRVIQQKVEDPLSDSLLSEEFKGCTEILLDLVEDEIVLRNADLQPDETSTEEEAVPAA
jgi:ATP-dependent Clp protease ATP-binding subunit ClpC